MAAIAWLVRTAPLLLLLLRSARVASGQDPPRTCEVPCAPDEYKEAPLVVLCDGGSCSAEVQMRKGQEREMVTLPAGLEGVRIQMKSQLTDMDLELKDFTGGVERCVIGAGCVNEGSVQAVQGCSTVTDFCIDYAGMSWYFTGDRQVAPVEEELRCQQSTTRILNVVVKASSGGVSSVSNYNDKLDSCPESLPGCKKCEEYSGCGAEDAPLCDGSATVVCLPPTTTTITFTQTSLTFTSTTSRTFTTFTITGTTTLTTTVSTDTLTATSVTVTTTTTNTRVTKTQSTTTLTKTKTSSTITTSHTKTTLSSTVTLSVTTTATSSFSSTSSSSTSTLTSTRTIATATSRTTTSDTATSRTATSSSSGTSSSGTSSETTTSSWSATSTTTTLSMTATTFTSSSRTTTSMSTSTTIVSSTSSTRSSITTSISTTIISSTSSTTTTLTGTTRSSTTVTDTGTNTRSSTSSTASSISTTTSVSVVTSSSSITETTITTPTSTQTTTLSTSTTYTKTSSTHTRTQTTKTQTTTTTTTCGCCQYCHACTASNALSCCNERDAIASRSEELQLRLEELESRLGLSSNVSSRIIWPGSTDAGDAHLYCGTEWLFWSLLAVVLLFVVVIIVGAFFLHRSRNVRRRLKDQVKVAQESLRNSLLFFTATPQNPKAKVTDAGVGSDAPPPASPHLEESTTSRQAMQARITELEEELRAAQQAAKGSEAHAAQLEIQLQEALQGARQAAALGEEVHKLRREKESLEQHLVQVLREASNAARSSCHQQDRIRDHWKKGIFGLEAELADVRKELSAADTELQKAAQAKDRLDAMSPPRPMRQPTQPSTTPPLLTEPAVGGQAALPLLNLEGWSRIARLKLEKRRALPQVPGPSLSPTEPTG